MVVKVVSHNQKGGITANTVNAPSQKNVIIPKKSKKKVISIVISIIITVIFLIAAIVAILEYLDITPGDEKMDPENNKDEQNIYVTSYDQQGGITANQVNIGSQPRVLNDRLKIQLDGLAEINKDKVITVTSVMGDGEAFQFATQVKEYLESQNWEVKGVNQAVYSKPIMGQTINPESTEIIIGTKQ